MDTKKNTRVLIVDDDIGTCETLSDIFEINHYQTLIAHNGKDSLALMKNEVVDVAMLDIRLPDIDGLDLLEKMKQISPTLIGVFITGHASIDYARRAIEKGANGFFVKPLIIEEILFVINEALEKRSLALRYKETSAKLQNIIGASNDAIFAIDSNGMILQCNNAAEDIFGYSVVQLIQMNIGSLLGRENGEGKFDAVRFQLSCDKPEEVYGRTKNGDSLVLEISSGSYDEDGKSMFSLIIRDVSARKKHEEEKTILQNQLIQANKHEAIGTLAGGIAHDFNNILTAIIGFSQLVKNTLEAESSALKDIEQVLSAGHRAKDLVRQILAFSRKSGEEVQPVYAHLIIKEVLELLRSSIPKSIEIITKIDTKRAVVLINPIQFHQVIMNLCVNAYHAMSEIGTLEVGVSTVLLSQEVEKKFKLVEGMEYLELVVKDTGRGMDHSTMARIFEPYFSTKPMEEGTGLGLSTAHGIIFEMGGAIDVKSKLGEGSIFTVYLPLIKEQISKHDASIDEDTATGKERILFIDDEMPIAELGKRILENYGYNVSSLSCSSMALKVFKENPSGFDLIITDNSMPEMTGTQLANEIYEIRPDVPVILVTGSADNINKNLLGSTGVKKILIKPVSIKELSETVRGVLDGETQEIS